MRFHENPLPDRFGTPFRGSYNVPVMPCNVVAVNQAFARGGHVLIEGVHNEK
jgi:hypothetical protein